MPLTAWAAAAVFILVATLHHAYRRASAKSAVEQWLRQHKYRATRIRTPWFRSVAFEPTSRDSDDAFDFEATVEDTQLGGTGTVFLRVWTGMLGGMDREIEVVWDTIPEGSVPQGSLPLWERLANAQLDILRRVDRGETAFYAPRNLENGGAEFNELAEHVLALSRRGMLTCGQARMDDHNANQYVSIGDLAITEEGKAWLASQTFSA